MKQLDLSSTDTVKCADFAISGAEEVRDQTVSQLVDVYAMAREKGVNLHNLRLEGSVRQCVSSYSADYLVATELSVVLMAPTISKKISQATKELHLAILCLRPTRERLYALDNFLDLMMKENHRVITCDARTVGPHTASGERGKYRKHVAYSAIKHVSEIKLAESHAILNANNFRSLNNQIAAAKLKINWIICDTDNDVAENVTQLYFCANVKGCSAIIKLQHLTHPAVMTAIHLFRCSFNSCILYTSEADGALYICGQDAKTMSAKLRTAVIDYIENLLLLLPGKTPKISLPLQIAERLQTIAQENYTKWLVEFQLYLSGITDRALSNQWMILNGPALANTKQLVDSDDEN